MKNITLITIVKGTIDEEIIERLKGTYIGFNVVLSPISLFKVQAYLYGNCGFSMREVIAAKLDALTIETLNDL